MGISLRSWSKKIQKYLERISGDSLNPSWDPSPQTGNSLNPYKTGLNSLSTWWQKLPNTIGTINSRTTQNCLHSYSSYRKLIMALTITKPNYGFDHEAWNLSHSF